MKKLKADKTAINKLMQSFFAIFNNKNHKQPQLQKLYDLCIPETIIIKNSATDAEIFNLDTFIQPREQLLSNGSLLDFEEIETQEKTHIFGKIAQRISIYHKSGILSAKHFETRGVKITQFIKTPAGWRISALAWDDERAGLQAPNHLMTLEAATADPHD